MAGSLARRTAVAAVGIPAALGFVYLGAWPLVIALLGLAVLGSRELFDMAALKGVRPIRPLGYFGAAAAPVVVFALVRPLGIAAEWLAYGTVGWLIATMGTAVVRRAPAEAPLAAITVTLFAPVYAGLLPAFLLVIRHGRVHPDPWAATWLVFLPLVVTWVCDSAAMGGGALFGGPKFAPVVSPKKTWSGTISGSVSAAVVAPVYWWLLLRPRGVEIGIPQLVLLGVVLSVVGQVGDLAESLLKREAGVKDSGTFFPGHGGVLDRLDSLYWVLPTAAAMLSLYGVA